MPFVKKAATTDTTQNRRQTLPATWTPDQQQHRRTATHAHSLPKGRLSPSHFDALFAAAPVPRTVLKKSAPIVTRHERQVSTTQTEVDAISQLRIPVSATRSTLTKFRASADKAAPRRARASLPLPSVAKPKRDKRYSLTAMSHQTLVYIKPDPEDIVDELDLLASPAPPAVALVVQPEPTEMLGDLQAVADSEASSPANSVQSREMAQAAAIMLGSHDAPTADDEKTNESQPSVGAVRPPPKPFNPVVQGDQQPVIESIAPVSASLIASGPTPAPLARTRSPSPAQLQRQHGTTPARPIDDILFMYGLSPSIFKDKKSPARAIPSPVATAGTPLTPGNLKALQASNTPKKQDAFIVSLPPPAAHNARQTKRTSFVSTEVDFAQRPDIVPARAVVAKETLVTTHAPAMAHQDSAMLARSSVIKTPVQTPRQSAVKRKLLSAAQLEEASPTVKPSTKKSPAKAGPSSPSKALTRVMGPSRLTTPEPQVRTTMDIPLPRQSIEQEVWQRMPNRKRPLSLSANSPMMRRDKVQKLVVEESPQAHSSPVKLQAQPQSAPRLGRASTYSVEKRSASSPTKRRAAPARTPRLGRLQKLAKTLAVEKSVDREAEAEPELAVQTPITPAPPMRSSSARKRLNDDVPLDVVEGNEDPLQVIQPVIEVPSPQHLLSVKSKSAKKGAASVPTPVFKFGKRPLRLPDSESECEDELSMLDQGAADTHHNENLEAGEQEDARQEQERIQAARRPKVAGSSILQELNTFGKQPSPLPRSKRQRKSPGTWWAAGDVIPKEEEEILPVVATKRGPGRPRKLVSSKPPPSVVDARPNSSYSAKKGFKSATNGSFDSTESEAVTRPGLAKRKYPKAGGSRANGNSTARPNSTHQGSKLQSKKSDELQDVEQPPKKRVIKGYGSKPRVRVYNFEDEDSDDL
ncbi:hypothetical protein BCR37DRAFT_379382 [Protomyces lactucae-debilis]|uniref:Uncharacterized protein n=1 Tax=Protomyces lactucae-debilis TaxID=2754530 RepID=A0A1Y2FET3_PROLT|nr:uncharacterized protein BCR37DRAFT_379382 [Protomyces lactucae-debilis]ORY82433.1 hypothetical protein BCR37DRAFT_379382 [Protomyces lactucae-debilis]